MQKAGQVFEVPALQHAGAEKYAESLVCADFARSLAEIKTASVGSASFLS
jgi:hypothetical protein